MVVSTSTNGTSAMMPPKGFGRHVGDGAHQHAAGRAALRDDAVMRGVALGDEMLGHGDEIAEGVGLLLPLAVLVPGIALVLAAADMGDGVDEAAVGQRQAVGVEGGRHGDAVGAVAVEQAGRRAVERRVAVVEQRDRHQFAVMRRAPSAGA